MRKIIENKLLEIGIMPNLKGFDYICDIVELITCNIESKGKLMYYYAVTAKKNNTTICAVERSIRTAISNVDIYKWNELYASCGLKNSEFLHTLSLKIKQED